MPVLEDGIVFRNVNFSALNAGEGYGRLQALDPDDRPNPRDIVLYETLPNELSRVAGIISTQPQTPLSHVDLRAKQNRIPNAFIRDAHGRCGDFLPFGAIRLLPGNRGWVRDSARLRRQRWTPTMSRCGRGHVRLRNVT